jgi:aldose sugar dehydrogenase
MKILILVFFSLCLRANTTTFKSEKLVSDLGVPWGMVFLDKDNILFTERWGKLGLYNLQKKELTYIKGLPEIMSQGQGGLLDVALAPDYLKNPWIYFTYSKKVNRLGKTTLARAKIKKQKLVQWQDLLVTKSGADTSRHWGSRITFDDQGHLFFGVGDRGERPNGQNLMTHAGSILRLNLDGTVPKDNPFIGRANALPEIWSYGHRNPQGLYYDRENKKLWEIEHGPRGGDELNLIEKGKNYGWALVSLGKEYISAAYVGRHRQKEGMIDSSYSFTPSIAPCGLMVYSGKVFKEWKGSLFTGSLKLLHLNRLSQKEGGGFEEERLLDGKSLRIRNVIEGPNGFIYYSTDQGSLYRLTP